MNKKVAILANEQHPFFEKLKELSIPMYIYEGNDHNWDAYELVYDFTIVATDEKIKIINQITKPVLSDLTCNWGELVLEKTTNLAGAFATGIHSPNNRYEFIAPTDESMDDICEIFKQLNIDGYLTDILGFGFVFPRTIVQIINEAHFALEENLASKEDIDKAMQFGVNYPLGPFEWTKKSNPKNIYLLLKELYTYTGNARYRPSLELQKVCL